MLGAKTSSRRTVVIIIIVPYQCAQYNDAGETIIKTLLNHLSNSLEYCQDARGINPRIDSTHLLVLNK